MTADTVVPDATRPQSANRYSYVENNPLNFTDSSGHCDDQRQCATWANNAGNQTVTCNHPLCFPTPTPTSVATSTSTPSPTSTSTPTIFPTTMPSPTPYQQQYVTNQNSQSTPISLAAILPDAAILGYSWGGAGGIPGTPVQIAGKGGAELLINFDEAPSIFMFAGGGAGTGTAIGASVDGGGSVGAVWNLDSHSNYAGPFDNLSIDASVIIGIEINMFWAPGGDTWGVNVGLVEGGGMSISLTRLWFKELTPED